MSGVVVVLNPVEREALIRLAMSEIRTPRDQARFIVRSELARRGLIPEEPGDPEPRTASEADYAQP